ncbi:MAG: hypothetical protein K1X64_07165 [Myxococcaceae bacterium]|nr:hypothetical protein [Myxococcaceae bacterium]
MPPPKQQQQRRPPKPAPPQKKRRVFTQSELDIIRRDLLVDAKTKELAAILKIPVEQYADKVIDYLKNPRSAPVWRSIPDAQLRRLGFTVPTVKQIEKRLIDATKAALKVLKVMKTAFVERDDKSERIGGNVPAAAPVEQASLDPELLAEVSKKRAK